jgi:aspartate kinase
MNVFKFGGASLKDAEGVKIVAGILKSHKEPIVVVVSAMGKTTNGLESIIEKFVNQDKDGLAGDLKALKDYHYGIIEDLFTDKKDPVYEDIDKLFAELDRELAKRPSLNYDHDYDQIICFGELLSTKILNHYLRHQGIKAAWKDVRFSIKTNNAYREARVDWEMTKELVKENFKFG